MNKDIVAKEPECPDELHLCRIGIRGRVDEADLNASSPFHLTVVHSQVGTTLLSLRTDPSGLIGLLRHLQARGHILLSVHYGEPIS
jgi:hypothetical protein